MKRPNSKNRDPLPAGWMAELLDRADLEHSFSRLKRLKHFYAETMRGRVRSLQMEPQEAMEHFEKAEKLFTGAPETSSNRLRHFLLMIYSFNNALLMGSPDKGMKFPEFEIPNYHPEVLKYFPELTLIINWYRAVEGLSRLHTGDWAHSARVFESLVRTNPPGSPDRSVLYYFGLAAAQCNLGLDEQARRNLENAGLAVQMASHTLNKVRGAAILYAFHRYLEEFEEAEDWRLFIARLPCPESTRGFSLKFGDLILKRSMDQSQLLLIP